MNQSKLCNFISDRGKINTGEILSLYKWKKLILKRDNNQCQICFNTIKDIYRKRNFSNEVHHIIARVHGGKNIIDNGITLCKFCHHYFDQIYKIRLETFNETVKSKSKQLIINEVNSLMNKRYKIFLNHLFNYNYKY